MKPDTNHFVYHLLPFLAHFLKQIFNLLILC